jgi:hypothetical protein
VYATRAIKEKLRVEESYRLRLEEEARKERADDEIAERQRLLQEAESQRLIAEADSETQKLAAEVAESKSLDMVNKNCIEEKESRTHNMWTSSVNSFALWGFIVVGCLGLVVAVRRSKS